MRPAALVLAALAPCAAAHASERWTPPAGEWRSSVYHDEPTGQTITMLTVSGDVAKVELMVACENHEILLLTDWGRRLSTEDLDVTEVLGKAAPVDRRWEIAEDDYQTLVHPARGAELLEELGTMEKAGTLTLVVTPDGKGPVQASFEMAGLTARLPELEGCRSE